MINSVLQQTYKDFELIIVNDGSTDCSTRILNKYASIDSRLVVINQENSGKPSIARNKGIEVARGDIITFLDADDIYAPTRLYQMHIAFEENTECALVIHDFNRISEDSVEFSQGVISQRWQEYNMSSLFEKKHSGLISKNEVYLDFFHTFFYIWTGSIAIRTSFYQKETLLFNESLTFYEDINKWCDLVVDQKLVFLKDVLSSYRDTPGSLMSFTLAYNLAGINFYKQHLYNPKVELPSKTQHIIKLKLDKEIQDTMYLTAKNKKTLLTIKLSLELLKNKFSLSNMTNTAKQIILSL